MVMKKIRQSKTTMRVPFIIMTIVLAVGMVGSFAIWSSPNMQNNVGKTKTATTDDQIKNLQSSITTLETSLKETPKDYSTLTGLAESQYKLGELYFQANKQDQGRAVIAKSLENYLLAMDNAPKELNNKGQADLMVKAANAAWYAGQESTSDALYQQAMKLVPDDFSVMYQYAIYLALNKRDFANAKKELEAYKAKLPTGDSRIANVDKLIEGIAQIEKAVKAPKDQKKTSGSSTDGTTQKSESGSTGTEKK